jgi:hypothetical protein
MTAGYNFERQHRGVDAPLRMAKALTAGAVVGGFTTVLLMFATATEVGLDGGSWVGLAAMTALNAFMTLMLAAAGVLLRWCAARFEAAAEGQRAPLP